MNLPALVEISFDGCQVVAMDIETAIIERRLPPPAVRRALREATGLSVIEIAEALGVGRHAIYRWEAGRREPRGANRKAYAGFLDSARKVIGSDG